MPVLPASEGVTSALLERLKKEEDTAVKEAHHPASLAAVGHSGARLAPKAEAKSYSARSTPRSSLRRRKQSTMCPKSFWTCSPETPGLLEHHKHVFRSLSRLSRRNSRTPRSPSMRLPRLSTSVSASVSSCTLNPTLLKRSHAFPFTSWTKPRVGANHV